MIFSIETVEARDTLRSVYIELFQPNWAQSKEFLALRLESAAAAIRNQPMPDDRYERCKAARLRAGDYML